MKNHHSNEVDELFLAILSLKNVEECYDFFEDVCTIKELSDIAQRLRAAKLLTSGESVMNACLRVGFSDCSQFITIFRRKFGVTPHQYKT